MKIDRFMEVMDLAEKLKNNTRHSWTSSGRRESVAEHSWRLMMMAYFCQDEFPELDMNKVLEMCLLHDMGEAFTGDIPAFEKSEADTKNESRILEEWTASLPEPYRTRMGELYREMDALETPEARLYKALDKMEAVLQHNQADLSTWLSLEYDLQLTYGKEETEAFAFTRALRERLNADTKKKTNR